VSLLGLDFLALFFSLAPFSCVSLLLKASMREQETAATVQDIEVRQMELESQRQLFEQVIVRELYRCFYLMVLPM